jgi:hypothetical protein
MRELKQAIYVHTTVEHLKASRDQDDPDAPIFHAPAIWMETREKGPADCWLITYADARALRDRLDEILATEPDE